MKKAVALLLALLLIFTLFACKKTENGTDTSSPPASSPDTTKPENLETPDSTEEHFDREPYKLVYMCGTLTDIWCKNIETAMKWHQEDYNYELLSADSNRDGEKFITLLETYADQDVDGFLLNADNTIAQRAWEVCDERGVPYLFESTAPRDDNGNLLTSGTELDAYQVGEACANWLIANYKTYWGDAELDQSRLGIMQINYSAVESFIHRCAGGRETLLKAFPNAKLFEADLVAQGSISAEAAYDEVGPILAANSSSIDYWFITSALDPWGLGAVRAIEDNGLDVNNVLMSTAGGEVLVTQWDTGYDEDGKGAWKSCAYYEAYDYVKHLIPGMIDHLEKGTPIEDLWPEWVEEGRDSVFASIKVPGIACTKENYKDYVVLTYG